MLLLAPGVIARRAVRAEQFNQRLEQRRTLGRPYCPEGTGELAEVVAGRGSSNRGHPAVVDLPVGHPHEEVHLFVQRKCFVPLRRFARNHSLSHGPHQLEFRRKKVQGHDVILPAVSRGLYVLCVSVVKPLPHLSGRLRVGEVFITLREPDACLMRGLRAKAIEHGRTFLREAKDDDLGGLASELAFKLTLATFPLLLFLAALSSYLFRWFGTDDPAGRVISALGDSLPPDAASVIERSVNEVLDGSNPGIVSIGAITTLWAASGAARALIKAVNRVNDLEDTRPGWQRAGLAVGLTLFGGIALLGAISWSHRRLRAGTGRQRWPRFGLELGDRFGAVAAHRGVRDVHGAGLLHGHASRAATLPLVVARGGVVWPLLVNLRRRVLVLRHAVCGLLRHLRQRRGMAVFLIWLNISSWLLLPTAKWNWVMEQSQAAPAVPPGEPASLPRPRGPGRGSRRRRTPRPWLANGRHLRRTIRRAYL